MMHSMVKTAHQKKNSPTRTPRAIALTLESARMHENVLPRGFGIALPA